METCQKKRDAPTRTQDGWFCILLPRCYRKRPRHENLLRSEYVVRGRIAVADEFRLQYAALQEDWNNRKMAKECTPDEMSTLMGGRRARRWRNEKALRDLAGPMSAEHMASLFSPAPFGVQYDSAWTVAMHPDNLPLWEEFISIDMDEESTVLAKARTKSCSTRDPLRESRNSWQRMGSRYRRILCRAAAHEPSLVKCLEDVIVQFDYSLKEERVVRFDSRFERLIFQGLCDYHDVFHRTSNVIGDSAQVCVWTRRWENLDLLMRIPCIEFLAHIGKIDPEAPMTKSEGYEQGWVVLNGH